MDVVDSAADVREGAPPPLLVLSELRLFLDEHGLGRGPVEGERIGDGHSQETFLLRRGELELVLRRPPRPPFAANSHDVLREARVLHGVARGGVRAPRLLAACSDPSVIGAPFILIEHVEGPVIGQSLPPFLDRPEEHRRIADELVDALVELHACDPDACGLGDLRRPGEYLPRQLQRFRDVWSRAAVRDVPVVGEVAQRLVDSMPPPQPPTLIHGDYRLGNVIFAPAPPARLAAILDWETTTIGDPLSDVGYLAATWPEGEDREGVLLSLASVVTPDRAFPGRMAIAERYAERSGRSTANLPWYAAFTLWKTAISLEGSYRRLVEGTATDTFFHDLEAGVPELASRAIELLEHGFSAL